MFSSSHFTDIKLLRYNQLRVHIGMVAEKYLWHSCLKERIEHESKDRTPVTITTRKSKKNHSMKKFHVSNDLSIQMNFERDFVQRSDYDMEWTVQSPAMEACDNRKPSSRDTSNLIHPSCDLNSDNSTSIDLYSQIDKLSPDIQGDFIHESEIDKSLHSLLNNFEDINLTTSKISDSASLNAGKNNSISCFIDLTDDNLDIDYYDDNNSIDNFFDDGPDESFIQTTLYPSDDDSEDEIFCIPITDICIPSSPTALDLPPTKNYLNKSNRKNESQQKISRRHFHSTKESRSNELFMFYNDLVFQSKLPKGLEIVWNNRLLTTAGRALLKKTGNIKSASIEMSIKVCDNDERLCSTLIHELCHVAAWLIDGIRDPPHGKQFKHWAMVACRNLPGMTISTKHNYEIYKPHKWQCSNSQCGQMFTRHTKKGIDLTRSKCGKCQCSLFYVGSFSQDGKAQKVRTTSGFSLFVKENFARVKAGLDDSAKHGEIMRELSRIYKLTSSLQLDGAVDPKIITKN